MSDFYQILKREIEPKPIDQSSKDNGTDQPGQISAVENSVKKPRPLFKTAKEKKSVGKKNLDQPARSAGKKNIRLKDLAKKDQLTFLASEPANPIWLTMAEMGKLGGIKKRTIKRALRAGLIKYRVVDERYQVDLRSALIYLHSKKKLWNKLLDVGLGQYVEEWKN